MILDLSFDEFVKMEMRAGWVVVGNLELYVRDSGPYRCTDYDVVNYYTPKPGRGDLTEFLDRWEPEYNFYFENVHNERLAAYLVRRGYTKDLSSKEPIFNYMKPEALKHVGAA